MSQSIETTKVQERGVITLPRRVREKLGIKKGSTVAFIETPEGNFELRSLEAETMATLDVIGAALREKGISLNELITSG